MIGPQLYASRFVAGRQAGGSRPEAGGYRQLQRIRGCLIHHGQQLDAIFVPSAAADEQRDACWLINNYQRNVCAVSPDEAMLDVRRTRPFSPGDFSRICRFLRSKSACRMHALREKNMHPNRPSICVLVGVHGISSSHFRRSTD